MPRWDLGRDFEVSSWGRSEHRGRNIKRVTRGCGPVAFPIIPHTEVGVIAHVCLSPRVRVPVTHNRHTPRELASSCGLWIEFVGAVGRIIVGISNLLLVM